MKIIKIIKKEINDWKWFEVFILVSTFTTIILLSIFKNSSLIAIFQATTGIIGVVLGSKGKISCYLFTIVSQILYVVISFNQPNGQILMSAIILALVFYIPMNCVGFFKWLKKRDQKGNVIPRRISFSGIVFFITCFTLILISYCLIINEYTNIKVNKLWLDATIMWTVIFGILLYIFRFIEQWFIWFVKNIIMILMWIIILIEGKQDQNAIIMIPTFIAYLINNCYGFFNWFKLYKKTKIFKLEILTNKKYNQLSYFKKFNYKFQKFFLFNPSSKFWVWKANK